MIWTGKIENYVCCGAGKYFSGESGGQLMNKHEAWRECVCNVCGQKNHEQF